MESQASSLYAAIDLGSNSFHLLVVRKHLTGIQTMMQMKRKVRLASGLDSDNRLSEEAMQRALNCIRLFAEQLTTVQLTSIRVVATATLRMAINADEFVGKASQILAIPVQVLSGEQEAELIYRGVCQTSGGPEKKLVIDIGGASTELITGCGHSPTSLNSLPMGCVTWLNRFFTDHELSVENFDRATQAAHSLLGQVTENLNAFDWEICLGASGTLQALYAIVQAQDMLGQITLETLFRLRSQAIQCGKLELMDIQGLTLERALVFPSGLAILIAIFEALSLKKLELAGGALREGLIYSMLPPPTTQPLLVRTIQGIQQRFHIDANRAQRVKQLANQLSFQVADSWTISNTASTHLNNAIDLHEIGFCVEFRNANQHAAYLLQHIELAGFNHAQRALLVALVQNQSGPIHLASLSEQNAITNQEAKRLCRLMRLALIWVEFQAQPLLPPMIISVSGEDLHLQLPYEFAKRYPLRYQMLVQESHYQQKVHWLLELEPAKL